MNKLLTAIFVVLAGALFMAGPAAAQTCELSITGNDQMQYDKSELVVPADCDQVTVTLEHVGQMPKAQMGHNWVLTQTADMQSVVAAGMQAGLSNDYLPSDQGKIIAHTELVGGGESSSVTFDTSKLEAGQDYTYFCSFPGHSALMKGKLVVK